MGETVRCPACGATQTDLWDYDWGSHEWLVASCGTCGADYVLRRRVSVDYEALAVAQKEESER